jgi:hypothetical protein
VATAIQNREKGKSQIKIIPEDEFLRMLNGETLAVSEEDLRAMQEREVARQKAIDAEKQTALEKQRLHEEMLCKQAAKKEARRKTAEEKQKLKEKKEKEKQLLREQREKEKQQLAAKKASKVEQHHQQEEARKKHMYDNVLFMPGDEPAAIRKRIDNLFAKLDEAYPDRKLIGLQKDHKNWAETVTALYRLLGYSDNRSFLEAYGYTVVQGENKGGRPTNDHAAVIEELKRRYPNGGCKNVAELQAANSDLPIKTLVNNAQKLFGKSLKDYLQEIGVL